MNDLNLRDAERALCLEALRRAGSLAEAAQLLGLTRHALSRRITKHKLVWPASEPQPALLISIEPLAAELGATQLSTLQAPMALKAVLEWLQRLRPQAGEAKVGLVALLDVAACAGLDAGRPEVPR